MTCYRLLRDNKESGPFSEEEMIAKGFKPYDLIWVEGKSAGWRYPSEIPAFKNFAPVIEEQPYDRFYKKQPQKKLFVSEEKNTSSSYAPAVVTTNETIQPQQFFETKPALQQTPDYTIQSLPGRHIHVTLPSGNTVNLTTLAAKKENKESNNKEPGAIAEANKIPAYIESRPVFNEPVYNTATPVIKETKKDVIASAIENAGNDTEPVYINQPRAYQPATGFQWSLIAAAFIGIATLVGLGIMIGLAMNHEKNDQTFNESTISKSNQTVQSRGDNGYTKSSASGTIPKQPVTVAHEALQLPSTSYKELVQNAVVKNTVSPENNNASKEIKKLPEEKPVTEKRKPLANEEDEPVVHSKPVPVTVNIEKNLLLTANDFKTGAFGGISSLKCTLYNGSKFPLESVEVEVDYIQANNKIFKTEKILFRDILAGAQTTIEAPSSSRGVKITSRIIKVNARDAALSNTTAKS